MKKEKTGKGNKPLPVFFLTTAVSCGCIEHLKWELSFVFAIALAITIALAAATESAAAAISGAAAISEAESYPC